MDSASVHRIAAIFLLQQGRRAATVASIKASQAIHSGNLSAATLWDEIAMVCAARVMPLCATTHQVIQ